MNPMTHIPARARPWARNGRQAGFTLIELMVSVAIGLFLVASIGGVYVAAKGVFASTHAAVNVDENVRAAFDLIGNSIRQTGFYGCSGINGTVNGDTRGGVPATNVLWSANFAQPVQTETVSGTSANFPTAADKTGVLMVIGVDPQRPGASVINDDPGSAVIATGAPLFNVGDVLLATTCQLNSYFTVTAVTSGATNTITHDATGTPTKANCSTGLGTACAGGVTAAPVPVALTAGALILPMVANAYYIRPSGTAGKGKSLWDHSVTGGTGLGGTTTTVEADTELVNGIENLAVEFGVDTDGDGSVNGYVDATGVSNWAQVLAIRVHLLAATLPDAGTKTVGSNTYTFNGVVTTPTDTRIYREYTAIFALRNRTN